jgi:hypothetical protein
VCPSRFPHRPENRSFWGPGEGPGPMGRGRRAMGACACCLPGHAPPSEGGGCGPLSIPSAWPSNQAALRDSSRDTLRQEGRSSPRPRSTAGPSARAGRVVSLERRATCWAAQLSSSPTVKADCPSRLPQSLVGAINPTLSPERPVPAEEVHAHQCCDPRIEHLNDQLTATDTL